MTRRDCKAPFDIPVLLEQWGTPEQWNEEREGQGVFAFSEEQIAAACGHDGGYLGTVCGVGCYVKSQPPVAAG